MPTLGRPTIATATSCGSASAVRHRLRRQAFDDLVEKVSRALAVLGGNLDDRLETQPIELEGAVLGAPVVGLVDGDEDRNIRRPQAAGDLFVGGQQPITAIYNEHNDIGRLERFLPLQDHELVQRIVARPEESAGIDEGERRAEPLGGMGFGVARGPGHRRHNRAPSASYAVKQGGFAHVGPSDQYDGRAISGAILGHSVNSS